MHGGVRDNVREHPVPLRIRTDDEPDREFRLTRGAVTRPLRSAPWATCRPCGPAGRQEAYFGVFTGAKRKAGHESAA